MAKKNVGKVVAIALLAIVGLGSVAAIARNREGEEEKHVHEYGASLVCECGERQEGEILFSDVKAGMYLTGYSVRLVGTEEEFKEYLDASDRSTWDIKICFEKEFPYPMDGMTRAQMTVNETWAVLFAPDEPEYYPYHYYEWLTGSDGFIPMFEDEGWDYAIPSDFGKVLSVSGLDSELANHFKWVYVGFEGESPASSSNTENTATSFSMRETPTQENIDFWAGKSIYTVTALEGDEWTRYF